MKGVMQTFGTALRRFRKAGRALARRCLVANGAARGRGTLGRFSKAREGAAAVEFALVAGPFFFLLFAIIEVALVFLASQVLEMATSKAARLVLTGQAKAQNFDQTAFRNAICQNAVILLSCNGIAVDVKTYNSFASATSTRPTNAAGQVTYGQMGYTQGSGGDIVVIRVVYEWPVMMPTFGLTIGDLSNGNRLLMATTTFRNEPF